MQCSICLDDITDNGVSTACGHMFHSNCLDKALEVKKQCPDCRKTISKHVHRRECRTSCATQIHRIYLPPQEENVWIEKERKLLQMAAEEGSLQWYMRISEGSDDKNPANQIGTTPLHYAAQNGHWPVCKFIIQSSKEKKPKDKNGKTPFDLAIGNGHLGVCYFMYKMIHNIYEEGEENVFKYEDKLFQNFNTMNPGPWNLDQKVKLYHWAEKNAKLLLCELIFTNPLHYAAKYGHWSVVKFLLKDRKKSILVDQKGKTPLDLAAENSELGLIYLMYKIITQQYSEGEENVVKYEESLIPNIKNKFYYFEERKELFHWAAANGNLNICKLIIENPIVYNKNPKNKDGWTALHLAAKNGHLTVCQLILKNTYNLSEYQGWTPFHHAAEYGYYDICKEIIIFLTRRNVQNKNPQDARGVTPLHVAAVHDFYNICHLICATDIQDKNPPDGNGNTPLHWAAEKGYSNICQLIMVNTKDRQPKNNEGNTPFDLALPYENVRNTIKQKMDLLNENDDSVVILNPVGSPYVEDEIPSFDED